MSSVAFADVVHQLIDFVEDRRSEALVLQLIDTPWFQRLRDVSQTANTRLVYMFSEHSRFGHSIGVAYLAKLLMEKLAQYHSADVEKYRTAVMAAALLHDIGHMAPGSHTAYKVWFPDQRDQHEEFSIDVIRHDPLISGLLKAAGPEVMDTTCAILGESDSVAPWTWEIISGGGWNADRGNWCVVDSTLAGVSYGKYNIPALTEAMTLTSDKHLALNESRLDAMMHFALSRHAMYRQVYQHRVLLAADMLQRSVALRARDLGTAIPFADPVMQRVLQAKTPHDIDRGTLFWMRESWWRYHLAQWAQGKDRILADLSTRILDRRLFKTIRILEIDSDQEMMEKAAAAVTQCGLDPRYYLHTTSTSDVHGDDYQHSMLVRMDDGRLRHLSDAEPLFQSLVRESKGSKKRWIAVPAEAKDLIGRRR